MKIKFTLLLPIFILLLSCNNNEKKFIKKEKKIIELELENKKLKDKIELAKKSYPSLNYIKKSLIGKSVEEWNFTALSEFNKIEFEEEIKVGDSYEAVVNINLEDYLSGKYYFMKLFVSYRKINEKWELKIYIPIKYFKR